MSATSAAPGSLAGHGHGGSTANSLSVGYLVLATALCGVGISLTSLWMITQDWLYFPGLLLSVVGGLMLFSPRAGSNVAEPA